MEIIGWIILGALAGWIASLLMGTNDEQGALANIVVGILGALAGGFLMGLVGAEGASGLNMYSLIVAVVGSVALLAVYRALTRHAH